MSGETKKQNRLLQIYKLLRVIDIPIALLSGFCLLASFFVLFLAQPNRYYFFLLIPLIGVFFLTYYYLRLNFSIESPSRLILIDCMIFLLYLTFFLIIFITLITPEKNVNFFFY